MLSLGTILLLSMAVTTDSTSTEAQELECLAKNIYYEAPDEPYEGKLAVATVTMNRLAHPQFPKTICGVVYQPWQFSWTLRPRAITRLRIYQEAERIAREVFFENKRLLSIRNAMYFHNQTVTPKWSLSMIPIQRIGGHTFYVTRRT